MSGGSGGILLGIIVFGAIVLVSIVSCSNEWAACKAAGGRPVYEYKNFPSCWDAEGRRIFP